MNDGTTNVWAPAFLDMSAVAHELQVSTRQVRRLLSAGRLPAADVNIGRGPKGRRWRRDKLLRFIEGQGPVLRGGR